jgi:hypothetical protein
VKRAKRDAKGQKTAADSSSAVCKNCKQVGHSTSRSRECRNHIASKTEVFENNLGSQYQAFTRKLPFATVVNDQYKALLRSKVVSTSRDLRHIILRAICFTNYYCLKGGHSSISACIFKQQYWYSVCQLVHDVRITNSSGVPSNLVQTWNTFRASHPSIVYKEKLENGASQCLTEACKEVATSYINNIVETFEARLVKYLKYRLQNMFMVSHDMTCLYTYSF